MKTLTKTLARMIEVEGRDEAESVLATLEALEAGADDWRARQLIHQAGICLTLKWGL